MSKKAILFSLSFFLVLSNVSAWCGSMTFARFTVDVPSGWTVKEDENVVSFLAPDDVAAITVTTDETGGMTALELARLMSRELNGSEPQEDAGDYTFTFTNQNGVTSEAVLSIEGKEYVLITVTGEHPQIPAILDSISDN